MSQFKRFQPSKAGAVLMALAFMVAASGCKKKVPPPPPPPPATHEAPPPAPTPGRPTINSFSAEPSTIERGQAATLRWSISNATDMTIDQGLGAVQSQGTRQVFPSATTTYSLIANGPGGSDTRSVTVTVSSAPPPPPVAPRTEPTLSASEMISREGQDAYFDYDKSDILGDARQALTTDADLLKRVFARDPNVVVIIEGHCDERGSAEYNLGLGDRRATAAKEFLTQLGVSADRLKTISYGKERPQCTDATEDCYQK
ncbi:MAG: OmpA family protein, partial [Bryobacteraceae bacterium]